MGDMNAGTFFVESNFRSTVQNRYNVFFKPTLIVVPVLVMSGKKLSKMYLSWSHTK